MRSKSAADIKHKWSRLKMDLPKEGTKIRGAYDLFSANKGTIINKTAKEMGIDKRGIRYLCDFYELDIRNFGHGKWCLVGEWFGKNYIDYLADKVKK